MAESSRSKRKPKKLEPISYEELMGSAGMSGFVSFLEVKEKAGSQADAEGTGRKAHTQSASQRDGGSETHRESDTLTGSVLRADRETETVSGEAFSGEEHASCEAGRLPAPVAAPVNLASGLARESVVPTEGESHTVRGKAAVRKKTAAGEKHTESAKETVSGMRSVGGMRSDSETGLLELPTVSAMITVRDKRIRRALAARDGHSLGEQALYQALWEAAEAAEEGEGARLICMGYDRMARIANLHWTNVRKNLQALERKLAIETVEREDSGIRKGKTYRVFSAEEVHRRREAAGMVWVRRTRGVEFVLVERGGFAHR
jgi:hypothetical protein